MTDSCPLISIIQFEDDKMDYKKYYEQLIEKAQNRSILPTVYKEKHHIVPKCMGGTDDKENLIDLTAREHIVAHLLLQRAYPHHTGLLQAVLRMSKQCELNSHSFSLARKKNSELWKTDFNPMSKNNPESKKRRKELSKRQTENNIATKPEVREKMSQVKKDFYKNNPGPNTGKKASLETRKKQAEKASKRTGNNACRKKKYNLISPTGKIYYCEGTLMKVIKELELSSTPLKTYKGNVVPMEKRSQYNTPLRNNTTGWMLEEL